MKYLLDTHVILWALIDDERIGNIRDLLQDPGNEIYFSSASIWEIRIKYEKGTLGFPPQEALDTCREQKYRQLDVRAEHTVAVGGLSYPEGLPVHKDPFDKILIAQAKYENMFLLTADRKIINYDEQCIREI